MWGEGRKGGGGGGGGGGGCLCVFYFLFLFFLFLHFLDYLFCYAFETDLRFIYYIPEISSSSHNVWDYALCDII